MRRALTPVVSRYNWKGRRSTGFTETTPGKADKAGCRAKFGGLNLFFGAGEGLRTLSKIGTVGMLS